MLNSVDLLLAVSPQRAYSIKTRIKTCKKRHIITNGFELKEYIPLKQGLRRKIDIVYIA